jgi:hypothetical protein
MPDFAKSGIPVFITAARVWHNAGKVFTLLCF